MDHERPSDPVPEESRRGEWTGIVLRLLVAAVVLVGGYVALAYFFGDRIPSGTTVEGIDVGTLSRQDAQEVLGDKLSGLTGEPVVVTAEGEQAQLDPAQAGLSADYDATLGGTTGVSFDPRNLWAQVTGEGRTLDLQTEVEQGRLEAALAEVAPGLSLEPVEGQVVLSQGQVSATRPEEGHEVDVPATAEQVAQQWSQEPAVEAVLTELRPVLTTGQVQTFVNDVAEPALASPVDLVADDARARLSPNQLSRLLTVQQDGDTPGEATLRLTMDDQGLVDLARDSLAAVERPPRDASVQLSDGGVPEIIPGQVGIALDEGSVLAGVHQVLGISSGAGPDDAAATSAAPGTAQVDGRVVTVRTLETKPDITAAESAEWRVDSVMAEFTSQFPTGPDNEARTENIRVGLRYLNGMVVLPGKQFSLADALAPISTDRGYVDAGVIRDGRLVEGIGGGLSQVSTTVLNTAWFAGLELDEFTPHSYYISRYPVGREATISVGQIDNRWTNDTNSPVVIQTYLEGDEIVMRFWGDRKFRVETTTGERRDVEAPKEFDDDSQDCLDQGAVEGFTITVTRTLSRSGDVVRTEPYTTTYQPSPGVTCTAGGGR
ncbi:MAG: VanW family protein [Actinobacteria bacterium]|nr:VanW family protein [Actinomycetota bacterium]